MHVHDVLDKHVMHSYETEFTRPHLSAAGSLSFLVVGDWGGQEKPPYYTQAQKAVAAAMGTTAHSLGSQFTVSLGDNFYKNGVKDDTDPRFKDTFEVRCCV